MKGKTHSRRALLVLAVVLTTLLAVSAMVMAAPVQIEDVTDGPNAAEDGFSHRLIVQLQSPSLSELATVPMLADGRMDLAAPEAQSHIAQLQAEQAAFVSELQQALPSAAVSTYLDETGQEIEAAYQVVFNGLAIDPGKVPMAEARRTLEAMPGVKAVFHDYRYTPDLYASLPLINAPALWSELGGREDAGSGVKIASMDGGLHHEAPMFDGTGWSYPPGWPEGGLGDEANNNGKIIASRAYFRTWDPPAPGDENTWPGENGTPHGTHTGSTAGGNVVTATYAGTTVGQISGVAPGAWLMSYRVFYNSVTADGSFYTAEGIAALEDIVADGADVVNNSWGGGPGSIGGEFDPLDQALINAVNAGVFVSMSAGNAGPGLGTGDHPSPDYMNAAASTTDGTFATGKLGISEPTPVPTDATDMAFTLSTFGGSFPFGEVFTYTFAAAANVDAGNFEGCDPWPAGTFDGMAAVISRGACEFGVKVLNAEQAGAEFVVVHNTAANGDELISMAPGVVGNQVTIPSVFVGYTDGSTLTSWHTTHGAASVLELSTIAEQIGNTPDVIANFSSRGPNPGNVLKPDIAAPGVNIMAQGYTPGATGEDRHLGWGQASGTSMAAPHVAGAAALVREAHPDWSVAQIKSALMSTSKYLEIYNGDGSPAQPLDMGAGRLDLTNVTDPGVILSPPSLSFGEVTTGTQEVLEVSVTSVADATETYALTTLYTGGGFDMTTSLPGFAVSPLSITLDPGESTTISVTFDSATSMGIGDNQGYVILDGDTHHAHMPAWARVTPEATGDVLIVDNDGSFTLGFPDYTHYYSETLAALGYTPHIWDADTNYANPVTLPSAAELSAYKAIVYYTGDNFYPDGTFTVQTPLTELDMDILTEYANGGGIIIAMGQDLAAVLNSADTSPTYFYESVLGGEYLQDSITGFSLPDQPITALPSAPAAFEDVELDLSGPGLVPVTLTGANEVPPVATTMQGEVASGYNQATGELSYFVTINVSNPVTITAAHIHTGTADVSGPVLVPIFPFTATQYVTDTISWNGSVSIPPGSESDLLSGGLYYNVHTTDNPGGEIRAQVAVALNGDGAGNQWYIDEIAAPDPDPEPIPGDPYPYGAVLQYPGPNAIDEGVVAVVHRDQPSLEQPGIDYLGRSFYTTFGLEGVNNAVGATSRAELLGLILDWAMDEPTVVISDITSTYDPTGQQAIFQASVNSNIAGTTGTTYRWDFGDGSEYAGPFTSDIAGHDYEYCGTYTVRVEATDSWGNVAIGSLDVEVTQNCTYRSILPIIFNNYAAVPES